MRRSLDISKLIIATTEVVVVLSLFFIKEISYNYTLLLILFFYFVTFLAFLLIPKRVGIILVLITAGSCLFETLSGLLQLLGLIRSNHPFYVITGSFNNPGPYGGFLATCLSILAAYIISNKKTHEHSFAYKLFFWIICGLSIAAFILLPSTRSRSAILAFGFSMILFVFRIKRDWIRLLLKRYCLWIFLGFCFVGGGLYFLKKPSADGRFFIDKICIHAMWSNGWKGAGLGHFGGSYGRAQAQYFKTQVYRNGGEEMDWSVMNEHDRLTADCPNYAFNEFLMLGVETGPVVMLLFMGVIVAAITTSFKRGTIWFSGLTSLSLFAFFSYPFHIRQFQIMFPILLSACIMDGIQYVKNNQTVMKAVVLFSILTLIVVLKLPEYRSLKQAELSWKETEKWYNKEYYDYVVEDCNKLWPYFKNNAHYLFAYGHSLYKTGQLEKSDSILKIGTEISNDPIFWKQMGDNSIALGNYREAEERYINAFLMVPNRLYPLCLIAKLYYTVGDTARFLDMSQKIEEFIPKVESERTQRLRAEIEELTFELR